MPQSKKVKSFFPLYYVVRDVLFILCKVFFNLKTTGVQNVPMDDRGVIFAPNHVSYLDPPIVGVSLKRRVTYLTKDYLFKKPILGRLLWWIGLLPVKSEGGDFRSMRQILRLLEAGRLVAIFPEGTRSVDGELKEPELGVGFVAVKSRAHVVPVYIEGTYAALPKGAKFFRCYPVRVHFGQSFIPATDGQLMNDKDPYFAVSQKIMFEIKKIKENVEKEKRCS